MKCLLLTLQLEACACMRERERERERERQRERERKKGGGQCGVLCRESKVTITVNLLVACVTSETERILQ